MKLDLEKIINELQPYRERKAIAWYGFPWAEIKQDLEALQVTELDEKGKRLAVRSQCQGNCGKIFQAVGVAIPPTTWEL